MPWYFSPINPHSNPASIALYYYLFLPKSLINGGQWYFMFWSALGIVSIGFIALVYIFSRPRKYPLLTISLGLALISDLGKKR